MERIELLAALESATGPSRALDAEIAVAGGWERRWNDSDKPHGWYWRQGDMSWTQAGDIPPPYTASLDAGRTLLLPEWEYMIFSPEKRVEIWAKLGDDDTYDVIAAETARTVENAFCIAAIRARGEG